MSDILNTIGSIIIKLLFTILIGLCITIVVILSIEAYQIETRLPLILFYIVIDMFVALASIFVLNILWFEL